MAVVCCGHKAKELLESSETLCWARVLPGSKKCAFTPFSHGAQCHRMLQRPENVKELRKELGKVPRLSVKETTLSCPKAGKDECRELGFCSS